MIKSNVYWHDTEAVPAARRAAGKKHCDICIIGAGYTGLWTAYFIQQSDPSARVVLLESKFAGAGASGHNDGFFLRMLAGQTGRSLQENYGTSGMQEVFQALRESALEITRLCISKDFDVEFEASAIYMAATGPSQQREVIEAIREAEKLGTPEPDLLPPGDLRDVFGSAKVISGYRVGGGLVNPFKLARALAREVVANGAELFEDTAATRISESETQVCVNTENGQVFCDRAIIATDSFQDWIPSLPKTVTSARSYILVSERLTNEQLEKLNWVHRPGFISVPNPAVFARLTWDNRILLGGGFSIPIQRAEDAISASEQKYAERRLTRTFRYMFPALRDVRPEYVYGGAITATPDGLPRFGWLSPRVGYGYGYCGHGIISTHIVAKILRDIVLEVKSDVLDLPFVSSALHPAKLSSGERHD